MYASAYVWAKILGHLEATLGSVIVSNSFDDAEVVELNEEINSLARSGDMAHKALELSYHTFSFP